MKPLTPPFKVATDHTADGPVIIDSGSPPVMVAQVNETTRKSYEAPEDPEALAEKIATALNEAEKR